MPPCGIKSPQKTSIFGRLTYLTVQSNYILLGYHSLRCLYPDAWFSNRLYPLAFVSTSVFLDAR